MSIGLDLGSTQFRSLRRHGQRLIGRQCPCVYAIIADTQTNRRMIERDDLPFFELDRELVLIGDAALAWTDHAPATLRALLPDGRLPANDALAREILGFLLDAVLPPATFPQEICAVTIPGELLPHEPQAERAFFTRLIQMRGYEPVITGQGFATVLAELQDAAFSGIGISLGASQCEFSLVQCGAEQARCSIPWGTADVISDDGIADDQLMTDFLVELLLEAGMRINQHDGFRVVTQPLSIICSGGIVQRPEFEQHLHSAWQRASWPVPVRSIRIASDTLYTIARGCLIQAKLERQTAALRAA
ncbi:MAG TPA: hypothetical protein VFG20_10025 [Planctomycetaceae bacterium]|nr:hypothetical protein [Planctomycetaceae bacterium]